MYAGHIGYGINERYRSNRYAAKACNLIKPVAIDHGFKTLWITCNPDNHPSRRTCEILGCELVEIVDLPVDTAMYRQGDRQKCRYRWDLEES
jgi:tagatose 1,6-diphosphate aldolase